MNHLYTSKTFPSPLSFFIIFIFALNTVALALGWYFTFFWFDMLMHTLGGVWVGFAALWFLGVIDTDKKATQFNIKRTILAVLLATACVGLLWELFEYIVDIVTHASSYGFIDGLSDLFFDLLGASFAVTMYLLFFRRSVSEERARV
ncbi:MAG: hypothetical protein HYT28_02835 [Parcubacteria group bacterium]|nr:hypothetical protein [Parcubacteria group bacterium]